MFADDERSGTIAVSNRRIRGKTIFQTGISSRGLLTRLLCINPLDAIARLIKAPDEFNTLQ